jgi:predicted neuraminidase
MTKTFDGKNFERITGGKKLPTPFDESMGYELMDGSIKMYARTSVDCLALSISYDKGRTWTDGERTEILNANSRFYIGRTPSGKILLINNDQKNTSKHERSNLTVYLSDDDGKTFKYKKMLDDRVGVSYPDVDFYDGKIYVIYDRGRDIENKLVLSVFTEEEITAENFNPRKKYVLDI